MASPFQSRTRTSRRRARRRRPDWLDPLDDARTRRIRTEALESALGVGRPIRPETLAIIVAARSWTGCGVTRWTNVDVDSTLWVDVHGFCGQEGLPVPADVAEALWALLHALESAGRLERVEPFSEVIAPLIVSGGLDEAGRRRHAHPVGV